MINLFRRIRKRLINEGALKKYAIYAVGEILLVMIGILLALQVNDWNEDKKREKLEFSTLKEIRSNLLKDIEDFEVNIRIHEACIESSKAILNALENKIAYHDSLGEHLSNIPANPVFMPTKSAYENLKIYGVNLITNDSIRTELQGLYEARYAFTAKITEAAFDYDYQTFGSMYQREMSDYTVRREAQPIDYTSLYDNQQFKNLISHKMTRDKYQIIYNYKERIQLVKNIIQMIEEEIMTRH